MRPKFYYEYKYVVPHHRLDAILAFLQEIYGGSDPFGFGIVDSIYYDTLNLECFRQCCHGDFSKVKYRIRGYGQNKFNQFHIKRKLSEQVNKTKTKFSVHIKASDTIAPEWEEVYSHMGTQMNTVCVPAARIRYKRYRFRDFDFRITLDTDIEVIGLRNGIATALDYWVIPQHVLEIKTEKTKPYLPFFNLISLPASSFSKYHIGLNKLLMGI